MPSPFLSVGVARSYNSIRRQGEHGRIWAPYHSIHVSFAHFRSRSLGRKHVPATADEVGKIDDLIEPTVVTHGWEVSLNNTKYDRNFILSLEGNMVGHHLLLRMRNVSS